MPPTSASAPATNNMVTIPSGVKPLGWSSPRSSSYRRIAAGSRKAITMTPSTPTTISKAAISATPAGRPTSRARRRRYLLIASINSGIAAPIAYARMDEASGMGEAPRES